MIYNNILEAVGNTPMIKLNRIPDSDSADIFVKMEALNVGGIYQKTYSAQYGTDCRA